MEKVYLKDYTQPEYLLSQTILDFKLDAKKTRVSATYHFEKNGKHNHALRLLGEDMLLIQVAVDGEQLLDAEYRQTDSYLEILKPLPDVFSLSCIVEICPQDNTRLSGLYVSGDCLCTQCESTGFRRIVYSLDRPDVLSTYQVSLEADAARYPVVLANGDCVRSELLENGNIYKTFVDPAPKPSYLFALVAGEFSERHNVYTSSQGRQHDLYVYLPSHYPAEQADFAMQSLIKSMRWDEQKYNCHYDLNAYYIVAMADFNFGAMENKGLNIFNTSTLLTDPNVTTDDGYLRVLTVVGHEYFHNWTGNRVTLRDWFQLSLKEGLTTYREMRFAVDAYGPLARLDYIFDLVERQFPEDKGPTAHPILPDAYLSIDNFYTATTYTKGAEVLRMMEDLIGYDALTEGICSYLAKFDGKAATIDDFLSVLAEQCDFDIAAFKCWYYQKGTPVVNLSYRYDKLRKLLTIKAHQTADLPENMHDYQPKLLPIVCKLYTDKGGVCSVDDVQGEAIVRADEFVLSMSQEQQEWSVSVSEQPIVSAFRGLSAPVKHRDNLTAADNAVLIACDDDAYIRYTKSQALWLGLLKDFDAQSDLEVFDKPMRQLLESPALLSVCMRLPAVRYAQELVGGYDFDKLCDNYDMLEVSVAKRWLSQWQECYDFYSGKLVGGYQWQPAAADARRIRAMALYYMMLSGEVNAQLAVDLYERCDNLTDRVAALVALLALPDYDADPVLADFYKRSQSHDLVMDMWFRIAATSKQAQPLQWISELLLHKDCHWQRPNRIMACFAGWLSGNFASLHSADGAGYVLLSDSVMKMDAINPATAARMVKPLLYYSCYDKQRAEKMKQVLQSIFDNKTSHQLHELVQQGLC